MRKYFKGKLAWRNPLLLKVKLPKGKRWEFILAAKVWLARPPQVSLGLNFSRRDDELPYRRLRGDHDALRKIKRRSYRVHGYPNAYIKDYKPELNGGYEVIEGVDIVAAVLGGDLDLIL